MISRTVQLLLQRIQYAVITCLCALILPQSIYAMELISEPASLSANEITGALSARATVILLDRTTATLAFEQTPINVEPGNSNSVDLELTNTGINDLTDSSIRLTPPNGVSLNIIDTADYTASQQPDGSWLITLTNNLNAAQAISIPVVFTAPANTPTGSLNIGATFSGRDSTLATLVGEIANSTTVINIQFPTSTTRLFLSNSVSQKFVTHDEFVIYTLRVSNQSETSAANNVTVQDLLPPGLRFMPGTLKINGSSVADPAPSEDGRTLLFNVGSLAVAGATGDAAVIEYMAYISNATPAGTLPSPSIAFSTQDNARSNDADAPITVRKDPINSDTHLFGRVSTGECSNHETTTKALINTRLQSELQGNSIAYRVTINSDASALESYTLNLQLPASLTFEENSALLDGSAIKVTQHSPSHKSFTIKPRGKQAQHVLSFKAKANARQHGVFNTRIYAEYITVDGQTHTQQPINNSYQAEVQHGSFRRFSYWPRFARLGTKLRDGDIENIDELINKLEGETINHIYIVGHADNMKISDKNKLRFTSNQTLSEARANTTALYIKDKLGLSDAQISSSGRGALEPVTNNKNAIGRSINRRVELIVETIDKADINRLNILLGDEGFTSRELITSAEQHSGEILGVENIRLITETGRTVDTDEFGLYHFEALKPGAHVVQIDPDSIPADMEAVLCQGTTRHAGSSTSQFVEISDGLIWRANFYLQKKQLANEVAKISLHSSIDEKFVNFTLSASGSNGLNGQPQIQLTIPPALRPALARIRMDGKPAIVSENTQGMLITLPTHTQQWQHNISLQADSRVLSAGRYTLSAQLLTAPEVLPPIESDKASNSFTLSSNKQRIERYEFKTHFKRGKIELSKADEVTLEDIIFLFRDQQISKLKVIGHTDANPMSASTKAIYGDNYQLSKIRAANIARYIKEKLRIPNVTTEVDGKGASEPVNSNNSEDSRADNRRAELYITTSSELANSQLVINKANSEVHTTVPHLVAPSHPAAELAVTAPISDGIHSIQDGEHIASASMPIRVQLDSRLKIKLSLDGKEIPKDRIGFSSIDKETNKAIYTFFGIDMGERGQHRLLLQGMGPFGNARFEQAINYLRTGDIHRIEQSADIIANAADGSSPIKAKIVLLDDSGEVIKAASQLRIIDGDLKPFVANTNALIESEKDLVDANKEGWITFAPVNKAGLYKVQLAYNDAIVDAKIYVSPKYRDWVVVGLAEGTLGNNSISGNIQALNSSDIEDDFYDDGRLAFYAKGKILGKYLLTTAFDSSKQNKQDERFEQVINPDDYYTLYGDNTEQQFDAASREKLYIRLDADRFYAMFGDMTTGLDATQLSRYSRALTGFRAAYETERASVNIFAAETSQAFKRDEILGQGISGLYFLSAQGIVANSESIHIETRDRFRPEVIVETKTLSRFIDYNIDYQDGSLYFKQAVPRNADDFNPVYIVAEYESYNTNSEDIVAGGRAALKFNNDKLELGLSAIEDNTVGAEAELQGLDARVQITDSVELTAEYAQSEQQTLTNGSTEGGAYQAELIHTGKRLDAKLYISEQEQGFGLGQQNASNSAIRTQGIDTHYRISDRLELTTNLRQEENLSADSERDFIQSNIIYTQQNLELTAGASVSEDSDSTGDKRRAEKLNLGASQQFLDERLRLRAQTEWQINKTNTTSNQPVRHLLGADYQLTRQVDLYAEHEIADNDALDTNTSRLGLRARPWNNGTINSSVEQRHTEEQERSSAVFALTQAVPINENWKASFSFDQTTTLQEQSLLRINPEAPLASGASFTNIPTDGAIDNDFWAVSTGLAYQTSLYLFDNRLEYRNSDQDDKYTLLSNWKRELHNGVGHALRFNLFHTDAHQGNDDESSAELRYSSVYRPVDSRWLWLNRTELKQDDNTRNSEGVLSKRFVENLAVNYLAHNWQAAGHFGLKHQITETGSTDFKTNSFVVGSELRYDINQHWDIGAQYHRLFTPKLGLAQDSYGLSVGVDVAKNLWLSVGYNAQGYHDDDFSVNSFTAKGPFIKLRFKFDQNTFNLNGSNND